MRCFDWMGCSYGYVVSLLYKLAVGVFSAGMHILLMPQFSIVFGEF